MKRLITALLTIAIALFSSCITLIDAPKEFVYVSSAGDNANDGLSPQTPVASIMVAIPIAQAHISRQVRVHGDFSLTPTEEVSGLYLVGLTNIVLSGGWNADFSAQDSYSALKSVDCEHVVYIKNCINVCLSNFIVTGGKSTSAEGGGIFIAYSKNITLVCIVSNNQANTTGGGIYLNDADGSVIAGSVIANTASSGGGVYVYNSSGVTVSGLIINNTSQQGGGGLYLRESDSCSFSGCISNNFSSGSGAGVNVFHTHECVFSGSVISNSTQNTFSAGYFLSFANSNVFTPSSVTTNNCSLMEMGMATGIAIYVDQYSTNNILRYGALYTPNIWLSNDVTNNILDADNLYYLSSGLIVETN